VSGLTKEPPNQYHILYHNGGGDVKTSPEFKGYKISETQMLIEQIGDIPVHILVEVENGNYHAWLDYILGCLNRGNESFVHPDTLPSENYYQYVSIIDLTKKSGG
jgi:hypothetical protein